MATETFGFFAGYASDGTNAKVSVEYDNVTLRINDVRGHNGFIGHTMTCTVSRASDGQQIYNRSIVGGAADMVVNVPGNQHMVKTEYGAVDLPDRYLYATTWT